MLPEFATLGPLRDRYDTLYCDVWGVIRDGSDLLPPAVDALMRFRASGGRVCLVSNSPRRSSSLVHFLADMGLPDAATDAVVTSGDAIHRQLVKRTPGKAFNIGPERDGSLYAGLDLEFTDIEQADFISCTGPDDYFNGRPEDYDAVLRRALERGLDLVCANPDIVVQSGNRLVFCAGAIARYYRELGGASIVAGKPHRPIYRLAKRALEAKGFEVDLDRVLAIGDGPETDVEGASRAGVDCLFIADGILGETLNGGRLDVETAAAALKDYGVSSRYVADRLTW
ncbi:TIGR01459 family HAD-type hydrolase [Maricaulis maris]|uniref:HAD superfamily hydrolase (TIGR01459 family) n=1 Tax=Maricaulis maris TaxID=74318 RepID=A0A495DMV3_9PROT|nr:TIGR01459 family HAD-type hydrolase [Maricaulis maris]RKR03980.1 HAD superfamily hydrolase (TIGR01459 family) [Maricaulis maris]